MYQKYVEEVSNKPKKQMVSTIPESCKDMPLQISQPKEVGIVKNIPKPKNLTIIEQDKCEIRVKKMKEPEIKLSPAREYDSKYDLPRQLPQQPPVSILKSPSSKSKSKSRSKSKDKDLQMTFSRR